MHEHGALYGGGEPAEADPSEVDVSILPLDNDQRRAVRNARSEAVSVIIGPPGTGKSHTVAAAAVDAIVAERLGWRVDG